LKKSNQLISLWHESNFFDGEGFDLSFSFRVYVSTHNEKGASVGRLAIANAFIDQLATKNGGEGFADDSGGFDVIHMGGL
jgi:hypothetical protein